MDPNFIVKTEHFEGPLELLLSLIEKRKFFINDISLAEVTDEYIEHVSQMEQYSFSNIADFLVLASTLILIKSRSLLSDLDLSAEEEFSIEELEERLRFYKLVQDLSKELHRHFAKSILYEKEYTKMREPVFSPGKEINFDNIHKILIQIIENQPKEKLEPVVRVQKVVSLEEMIENLGERIQKNLKMSFSEFTKEDREKKIHIIISFLALLELVKQGLIKAHQDNQFEEITMEAHGLHTPHYG